MRIPRLLFRLLIWLSVLITSLLLLLWAAPAAAQSTHSQQVAPAAAPFASQPPATIPSWDGRTQIPVPHAKVGAGVTQAPSALNSSTPRTFSLSPKTLRQYQLIQPQAPSVLMSRNPERKKNQRCYTVREYRFQRDEGASDATTFKDYYACAPSTEFHLRAATSPALQGMPLPNHHTDPAIERCGFAYGNVCGGATPSGKPIVR